MDFRDFRVALPAVFVSLCFSLTFQAEVISLFARALLNRAIFPLASRHTGASGGLQFNANTKLM
jgi:hypothetical protein